MRLNKVLSARELQILRLVGAGYDYRLIACELRIKPRTVESTMRAIKYKLGTPNSTSAAITALRRRLLEMDEIPEVTVVYERN